MPELDLEPGEYRPAKGTQARKDKPREPFFHPMWPPGLALFASPFIIGLALNWAMVSWGWWVALIVTAVSLAIAGLMRL